jgi:uncharacterized phage protein gp47/JayE
LFTRKSYEEIRDDILAQITKGIFNEKHVYEGARTKYKLSNTPVKSIVKVEGVLNGTRYTFKEGVDYKLTSDMLEWLAAGDKPDDRTTFFISYIFGEPSGITDINPGSVVRTIVEAISREIDFLYAQLNHIYLAGFIDTATASALDLVVSILGVERKPAEHATGKVTFGRSSEPGEIQVESEAHVYDGKSTYELECIPVKSIARLEGTLNGAPFIFEQGIDYVLTGNKIEFLASGKKPDLNSVFYVDYSAYEQIKIPIGTKVSTYARRPEDAKVFITIEEKVLERTAEGRWEADVLVKAEKAGTVGNVYAGAITLMPQPLMGVEYVINRGDILNGVEAESDKELRERAKHALEVAGKATFISLASAVKSIEGVDSVLIEEMPDGIAGVVKIIVDGGELKEIERVINETRAAGIKVELSRPKSVHIDATLTIALKRSASVEREVEAKVRSYISSLGIGEDVIYSRMVGAVLEVDEVYDVSELIIKAYRRDGEEVITSTRENIRINSEERAVPRMVNVLIKTLEKRI